MNQPHDSRWNHHPLQKPGESNSEDHRHEWCVLPGFRDRRVVPLAVDGVTQADRGRYRGGEQAGLSEPVARSENKAGHPKRSQQNHQVSHRAVQASPNDVPGSTGVIRVKRRMQKLPQAVQDATPAQKRHLWCFSPFQGGPPLFFLHDGQLGFNIPPEPAHRRSCSKYVKKRVAARRIAAEHASNTASRVQLRRVPGRAGDNDVLRERN